MTINLNDFTMIEVGIISDTPPEPSLKKIFEQLQCHQVAYARRLNQPEFIIEAGNSAVIQRFEILVVGTYMTRLYHHISEIHQCYLFSSLLARSSRDLGPYGWSCSRGTRRLCDEIGGQSQHLDAQCISNRSQQFGRCFASKIYGEQLSTTLQRSGR